MVINLGELESKQAAKMQQVVQKESHKPVQVFTLLNDYKLVCKETKKKKQTFA